MLLNNFNLHYPKAINLKQLNAFRNYKRTRAGAFIKSIINISYEKYISEICLFNFTSYFLLFIFNPNLILKLAPELADFHTYLLVK